MEDREEMLEAIMVIIESSSDEEVFHIFNTLTATVQQENKMIKYENLDLLVEEVEQQHDYNNYKYIKTCL